MGPPPHRSASFPAVPSEAADPGRREASRAGKSLTYSNLVSHFKKAGLRPTEVQKRCAVFFEGEWKSSDIYNYCLIIVENSDEDLQVTFYLTDAHEMNWLTEFIDSPFLHAAGERQTICSGQCSPWIVHERCGPLPGSIPPLGAASRPDPDL